MPYIGDLLGVRGLLPIEDAPFSQRGLVANTIAYRRAKGTAAVLEQLARDVTGWGARAVEYFDRLATTRAMNHRRRSDVAFVDVRDARRPPRSPARRSSAPRTSPTCATSTTAAAGTTSRTSACTSGACRAIRSSVVRGDRAGRRVAPSSRPRARGRYTFSPLGLRPAAVQRPARRGGARRSSPTRRTSPAPLRRRPLHDELDERRRARAEQRTDFREVYFDDSQPVFEIVVSDGRRRSAEVLEPEEIAICDLSDSERPARDGLAPAGRRAGRSRSASTRCSGGSRSRPARRTTRSRSATPTGSRATSAAGPYDRSASVARALLAELPDADGQRWQMGVTASRGRRHRPRTRRSPRRSTRGTRSTEPAVGVIAVMDSRTYDEDLVDRRSRAGSRLLIVAADWPLDEDPEPERSRRPGAASGACRPAAAGRTSRGKIDVRGVGRARRTSQPGELASTACCSSSR